jgi:hypothetical protein
VTDSGEGDDVVHGAVAGADGAVTDTNELRELIREEIRGVLDALPGSDLVHDAADRAGDDADAAVPLTMRDVEDTMRRVVEDAMKPLKATAKKAPPKKASDPPPPEPVPAEPGGNLSTRLRRVMWGGDE